MFRVSKPMWSGWPEAARRSAAASSVIARRSGGAGSSLSPRRAHVSVRVGPDLISVRDDGTAADPVAEGDGLRGLRERLNAVGAQLEHGPVAGGGYELTARALGKVS